MKNFSAKHLPMLFNIVGFQTVWLLCVYGASHATFIPGLIAAIIFACVVSYLSLNRKRDMTTLALALPIGFIMDSALAKSGLMSFSYAVPYESWAPIWIMSLWIGFSFTLNHSLKAIYAKPLAIFLFGFFGAPIAYSIAAYKFSAMAFSANILSALFAIACVWGFGLMALQYLNGLLLSNKEVTP